MAIGDNSIIWVLYTVYVRDTTECLTFAFIGTITLSLERSA